jgi:hypothetical protein
LLFLDLTLFFGKESSMDEAGRFLDDELDDIFGGFNKHRELENCRSWIFESFFCNLQTSFFFLQFTQSFSITKS